MKTNMMQNLRTLAIVAALTGAMAVNAKAATEVTFKVNETPTVSATNPNAACPSLETTYASANFDLTAISKTTVPSTGVTFKYYSDAALTTEITGAALTAYTVNQGVTASVYIKAITTATECETPVAGAAKVDLQVYSTILPDISGSTITCALPGVEYKVNSGSLPVGVASVAWTASAGTISGATAATVTVDWTGVTGAQTLTATYTTTEGCTFAATYNVTVNALPTFTTTAAFVCDGGSVTLSSQVTTTANVSGYTFSLSRDMSNPITTLTPTSSATDVETKVYVTAASAAGCTKLDSFMVTKYAKIGAELVLVAGGNNFDACITGGSTDVNLKAIIKGGGSTATDYEVVLTLPAGITIKSGDAGVTVNGNKLTITKAAANAGATFTVTVTSGTDASVAISSVTAKGAAVECSATTF